MSNQLPPTPKDGLIAKYSLTLGIAFLFLFFRYLSRRREERRLVMIPNSFPPFGILTNYQEEALSSLHQCGSPPVLRGKWPLSLDLLITCIKADNANQILRFFITVLETTGFTHAQLLFGTRSINTVDPENIEVLLSTQFKGMRSATHVQPVPGFLTPARLHIGSAGAELPPITRARNLHPERGRVEGISRSTTTDFQPSADGVLHPYSTGCG